VTDPSVRVLAAPPDTVFRAFTDPALVVRWWGSPGDTMDIELLEARSGGSWRYVTTEPDGTRDTFHGVFHSVEPSRIVQTFEYGGDPGLVLLETLAFDGLGDGRTRLSQTSVASTGAPVATDGGGVTAWLDRLAALLADLCPAQPAGRD
jgi:uncharacterized protein YndB with AHSA1/START domain